MRQTIRRPPPPGKKKKQQAAEPCVVLSRCVGCKRLVDQVEWLRDDGKVLCGQCERAEKHLWGLP